VGKPDEKLCVNVAYDFHNYERTVDSD